MGLFGLFEKNAGGVLKKHADRVANKRAQALDRWESIQFLVRDGSPEAAAALLARFSFYVDPSITDQEEKDAVFAGVLRAGEAVLPVVRSFMATSESLSWPLKLMDRLADPKDVVATLLDLLTPLDIEYARDPQRKIQLLAALEERKDTRISPAVTRFLADANETVRFQAVAAIFAQDNAPDCRGALLECMRNEESVRVRNRIFDGFLQLGWSSIEPGDKATELSTSSYVVDARGSIKRLR